MKCAYCGSITTNSQNTNNCPNCGAPLEIDSERINTSSADLNNSIKSDNSPKIKPLKFKSQTTHVATASDSQMRSGILVIVSLVFVVCGIGAFCVECPGSGLLFILIALCGFTINRINI